MTSSKIPWIAYDHSFEPPAPVVPLRVRTPGSGGWVQLSGLVDTGADVSAVPLAVGDLQKFPVAGLLRVKGVTGDTEEVVLYRVDVEIEGRRGAALIAGLGDQAIVGRDLLERLILRLDGPARRLSIEH